jgi:sodium-dependent dicarboxylate transporter 2/3/5
MVDFKVTKEVQSTIKVSLRESYNSLGKISLHEIEVIGIFVTVLILWIGSDKHLFPGIGKFFKPTNPSLATPAVFGILLMFTIPRKPEFFRHIARRDFHKAKYETVMEWEYFHRNFPWGIVMLLGGGFAMSAVTKAAGLNDVLEEALKGLQGVNKDVVLIVVIYLATFFTEVASNTAIANIILPILFISSGPDIFNVHPMFLTFPATIACSHAFMFPVSTPPNSIAFAAGKMKVLDMLIPGVFLNFTTGAVLYVSTRTWGKVVYGSTFG